jgi:hypothetical protein
LGGNGLGSHAQRIVAKDVHSDHHQKADGSGESAQAKYSRRKNSLEDPSFSKSALRVDALQDLSGQVLPVGFRRLGEIARPGVVRDRGEEKDVLAAAFAAFEVRLGVTLFGGACLAVEEAFEELDGSFAIHAHEPPR